MIRGGTISYEDGVKAAQEYAPAKKVKVELHFDVLEGEDADEVMATVGMKARAKVYELLGIVEKKKTTTVKKPPAAPGAKPEKEDIASVLDDPVEDISEDTLEDVVVREITDQDMDTATRKKNSVLKDPEKIRNLINTFNPEPGTPFFVRQIPAERRQEYLDKLEALVAG